MEITSYMDAKMAPIPLLSTRKNNFYQDYRFGLMYDGQNKYHLQSYTDNIITDNNNNLWRHTY